MITFLLAGITCPKATRTMPGGAVTEADPYGDEALTFVKEMIMQREVEIEVESIGKYSTFTLVNLKITLVILKNYTCKSQNYTCNSQNYTCKSQNYTCKSHNYTCKSHNYTCKYLKITLVNI